MERADLASELIDEFGFRKYLEVGVSRGLTFFKVHCNRKVAVDPDFLFELAAAQARESGSVFYQLRSDEFFALHGASEGPFDLIFLDGLHTVEQILRDFLNSIRFLSPGGVILIDDVRPNSYASSLPDQGRSVALKSGLRVNDDSWMGDVYKIVPFLATFCQQFSFSSPLEIPNILIVWQAERASVPHRLIRNIADFRFEETVLKPELYNPLQFADIRRLIAASRDSNSPSTTATS